MPSTALNVHGSRRIEMAARRLSTSEALAQTYSTRRRISEIIDMFSLYSVIEEHAFARGGKK